MVRPWFSSEKKEGEGVDVLGFVGRAMGCFFGCFRIKDSNANLVSPPEPVVSLSKNALSSMFMSDDESLRKGEEDHNPLPRELDVKELKDEAKFLKACGTLPETPVEIRKALEKWEGKSSQNGVEKPSKFNSWLPHASMEKLKLEKQSDESPIPVKICEEWVTGSGSLMDSPSSCMTDGQNIRRVSSSSFITPMDMPDGETHSETSAVSHQVFAPSVQCKNKSVRFDCESDRSDFSSKGSSSENSSQHSKQSGSGGIRSVSKPSPYATPLKLTDEMQTPGTVFPAYMNDVAGRKVTNIRSQYVYSVINPVVDPNNQLTELKDENSDSSHLGESLKPNDEDNMMSTPMAESAVKKNSVGNETKNEASLSAWLKPLSPKQDGNNEQLDQIYRENVYWGKTPGDRPILGMVAAHWNDDETSHISPKWWDGNGIPNSTNKYKEDQKVSWHATPFEERLEKALSEETFISQRKPVSRSPPFELNETEESDTALSHLQSSDHIKSVVSF